MSGSRGTASGVALPPREAIEYLRGKANVTTQHWTDVWRAAHARSFMVAGAATDAIVGDFRRAVADALEQGTTLRDFRRQFDDIVARHGWVHNGTPAWRSRIIYETNLSTAYSAGRYAQQTEPDTLAVYPYWQYVHSGAAHPRLQHQAWNGLTLRADDPFWRTHYPPNGWRCGCRIRVLSARALARQGKSGPDPSPVIETRPWTNPRTGEVHQVPLGIDPGFDWNPGMAWRGPPQVPGNAVTRPPPGNWPPPAPGSAAPPIAPAQPPALVPPAPSRPAPVAPSTPPAPPGPALREPPAAVTTAPPPAWSARPVAADRLQDWIAAPQQDRMPLPVGRIAAAVVRAWVAAGQPAPRSRVMALTDSKYQRIVGKDARLGATNRRGNARTQLEGLDAADIERLPELLARPIAVLRALDTGHLVYVFRPGNPNETRLGRLFIAMDRVHRVRSSQGGLEKRSMAQIMSGSLVSVERLRNPAEYRLLSGKL